MGSNRRRQMVPFETNINADEIVHVVDTEEETINPRHVRVVVHGRMLIYAPVLLSVLLTIRIST